MSDVRVSRLVPMTVSDREWLSRYLGETGEDMSSATHWRVLYWENEHGKSTELVPYGVDMDESEGFGLSDSDEVDYWCEYLVANGFPRHFFE